MYPTQDQQPDSVRKQELDADVLAVLALSSANIRQSQLLELPPKAFELAKETISFEDMRSLAYQEFQPYLGKDIADILSNHLGSLSPSSQVALKMFESGEIEINNRDLNSELRFAFIEQF